MSRTDWAWGLGCLLMLAAGITIAALAIADSNRRIATCQKAGGTLVVAAPDNVCAKLELVKP